MPRPRKDASSAHFYLARDVQEMLEHYCNETGLSKTTAVERMLRKGMNDYFAENLKNATKEETGKSI